MSRRTVLAVAALAAALVLAPGAHTASTELFFSEYIEGSSNNKALEISNDTGAAIELGTGGYNVQMFFNGSATAGLTINLTGTVADDDVFVLAHSSADAAILAQADQTNGAGWFNGDDAVVLRKGATVVDVIGQIGLDPGTEWGSGLTSTADNTLRRKASVSAGDPDGANAFDPGVEWDGFATNTFDGLGSHSVTPGDAAPTVLSTTPANNATNVATGSDVTVTFSEPVVVSAASFSIACGTSGAHTFALSGGPSTYTLDPATGFAVGETCTVTVDDQGVSDVDTTDPPDTMAADRVISFTTVPLPARIYDVQGAAHLSPLDGRTVSVPGVVTAVRPNSFTMQDAVGDGNVATSDAILVFANGIGSTVSVGQAISVSGRVSEFRPGGATSANLTTTEIVSPTVTPGGPGATVVQTVIGLGGRVPPTSIIDDDAAGSVETGGSFDPATDGIDFYESLEAMLLRVNDPVVVGPTNQRGEMWVLADGGAGAGVRTARQGIIIRPTDFNPERIQLDDEIVLDSTPDANVGDGLAPAAVGVLDYNFGSFELLLTSALTRVEGGLEREVARPQQPTELAVATFNVENLSPRDDPAKFARLAGLIVNNLRAPDIVALEEIQDNDGPTNSTVTDASQTLQQLIAAIQAAGGPTYQFRQINPVDDQDGGQPGGNIRVGFIFRTDRGLEYVDRPGGTSTTATGVTGRNNQARLTFSPGRIDPQNAAWVDSRKPLAGEFRFRGKTYFVIVNHFNSKGDDQPLFARFQPPARLTETQRHQQAQVVNDFVDEILAADRNALVVVLGDINDFEFSETVEILEGGGALTSLMSTLPAGERYSYVFEGNSQVLDQILVTEKLAKPSTSYDVVHVNSEFFDQASDHEPQVARFVFAD
ncbi:MAG TPA: Ig-like domain-containing protein [Gaiella sp.]|nr:Ig-like domain-containing protein [Gaiella sp.]